MLQPIGIMAQHYVGECSRVIESAFPSWTNGLPGGATSLSSRKGGSSSPESPSQPSARMQSKCIGQLSIDRWRQTRLEAPECVANFEVDPLAGCRTEGMEEVEMECVV